MHGRRGQGHGAGDSLDVCVGVFLPSRPSFHPAVSSSVLHAAAAAEVRGDEDFALEPRTRAAMTAAHAAIRGRQRKPCHAPSANPPRDILRPARIAGTTATTADRSELHVRGGGSEVQNKSSVSCRGPKTCLPRPEQVAATTTPVGMMRSLSFSSSSSKEDDLEEKKRPPRHASTLEMISGKEHFPRPCPPEHVTGIGIPFTGKHEAQPTPSSPRCARTVAATNQRYFGLRESCSKDSPQGNVSLPADGATKRVSAAVAGSPALQASPVVPMASIRSPRSPLLATSAAGGGVPSAAQAHPRTDVSDSRDVSGELRGFVVATPYVPLLRSRSWDEVTSAESGRRRGEPFDEKQRGIGASDRVTDPSAFGVVEDFQLCVQDPSENYPEYCNGLGAARSPRGRGKQGVIFGTGGEEGRADRGRGTVRDDESGGFGLNRGGIPPALATPFSR